MRTCVPASPMGGFHCSGAVSPAARRPLFALAAIQQPAAGPNHATCPIMQQRGYNTVATHVYPVPIRCRKAQRASQLVSWWPAGRAQLAQRTAIASLDTSHPSSEMRHNVRLDSARQRYAGCSGSTPIPLVALPLERDDRSREGSHCRTCPDGDTCRCVAPLLLVFMMVSERFPPHVERPAHSLERARRSQ